jgi:hypothetical protein
MRRTAQGMSCALYRAGIAVDYGVGELLHQPGRLLDKQLAELFQKFRVIAALG